MRVPCHVARRIARRSGPAADAGAPPARPAGAARPWREAADAGAPPARLRGLTCTPTQEPYDLTVVACGSHKAPFARDVAFVWRDPARAPAPPAAAPQALTAPHAGAAPEDDPADEGSAEAHAA